MTVARLFSCAATVWKNDILQFAGVVPGWCRSWWTPASPSACLTGKLPLLPKALNGAQAKVHIKVETGMHRLGINAHQAVEEILELNSWPCFLTEGLFTHFAASGDKDKDSFTEAQYALFEQVLKALAEKGFVPLVTHCANSDAILRHPYTHAQMVRPGLMLYGYAAHPSPLRPVLSLKARIAQVKWVEAGETVSYSCTWTAPARTKIAGCRQVGDGLSEGLQPIQMLVRGQSPSGGPHLHGYACATPVDQQAGYCHFGGGGRSPAAHGGGLGITADTIPYSAHLSGASGSPLLPGRWQNHGAGRLSSSITWHKNGFLLE